MSEEIIDLLEGIKSGVHEDYELLKIRYAPLVSDLAGAFEASGAGSRDDLVQEAESALLKAALTYDTSKKEVTFGLYAKICMRNALISQRRKVQSRRAKSEKTEKQTEQRAKKLPYSETVTSEEIVGKIEALLSPYEKNVFREYMAGKRAGEIAAALGKTEKSVNNAIFRIRDKARKGGNPGAR